MAKDQNVPAFWRLITHRLREEGRELSVRLYFQNKNEYHCDFSLRSGTPQTGPTDWIRSWRAKVDHERVVRNIKEDKQRREYESQARYVMELDSYGPHTVVCAVFGPYLRPDRQSQAYNANVEFWLDKSLLEELLGEEIREQLPRATSTRVKVKEAATVAAGIGLLDGFFDPDSNDGQQTDEDTGNANDTAGSSWRLVTSESEILANIRRFGRESPERKALTNPRRYFAYDSISGWAAPAKFAGIHEMTIERYQAARSDGAPTSVFDGHATQLAIKKVATAQEDSGPALEAVARLANAVGKKIDESPVIFCVGPAPKGAPLLPRFLNEIRTIRRGHAPGGRAKLHKPLMLLCAFEAERDGERLSYDALSSRFAQLAQLVGESNTPIHPFERLRPRHGQPQGSPFWTVKTAEGLEAPQLTSDGQASGCTAHWLDGREQCLRDPILLEQIVATTLELLPIEVRAVLAQEIGFGHLEPSTVEQPEPLEPIEQEPAVICTQFTEAVKATGLRFGSRTDDFIRAFLASAATKRFVILTGLSGSGKTQIAMKLGEWFGKDHHKVVAVRPDWTGSEALFGYENAIAQPVKGRQPWHVPPTLEFMLEAFADQANPYLLLLDEMNLAHVERYFADVLSGIESGKACLPNLRKVEGGAWIQDPAEPMVRFPSNLFVVGTVNVDETTYMFSPKVLDRANTLEFRVRSEDLSAELLTMLRIEECEPGESQHVRGLLDLSRNGGPLEDDHPSWLDDYAKDLRELHEKLSEHGYEFGYRTYAEAIRFARIHSAMGGDDDDAKSRLEALDLLILQKVLPRLHGARRRIEPVLRLLAWYAHGRPEGDPAEFEPLADHDMAVQLPLSLDKIARMTKLLRANQFVSFAE